MAKRGVGRGAFVVAGLLVGGSVAPAAAQELSEQGLQQIRAILADKASWTPAQRKLDTSLLYASRESRGQAMVQGLAPRRRIADRARVDRHGMVTVRISAEVTDGLLQAIADFGGRVVSAFPTSGAVKARVPIRQVEAIAALPEVRFIAPPAGFLVNKGSQTTEGEVAHAVAAARATLGADGTGVKVGILSDGVDSLADRQGSGDLPSTCTNPPGTGACVKVVYQLTCGDPPVPCGGDEGTAMMEIVHDLVPGAQLYFAGVDDEPLEEEFAANILTLRNTYGCDIIVDDVTFFGEGAFQDGPIARAVNTVTAGGALYFSSAGNSGRKDAGTSGTWEGDFLNSGTTISPAPTCEPPYEDCWQSWEGLPIHSFNMHTGGSAANSNPLTANADYAITLKWSDPLGKAANDYDLFLLSSDMTEILDGSANDQGITREPYEEMAWGLQDERIVVVLYGRVTTPGQPAARGGGAARALRLDTNRGWLSLSTAGAIVGHNGGENTISVAAINVSTAGGGAFTGGAANPVEDYSSDGPRRMFYNPNGTAITTGKVTFASGGGRDLQKPDITAADCVTTTTPGFAPFCGTSAAAPHAAAIAALLKSSTSHPSTGQALAAMFATALDVDPAGRDRNAGRGIVMANAAADALTNIPSGDFYTLPPCRVFDTRLVAAQTTGVPLTCGTTYDFTVVGVTCGVPSGAKAVSLNVTVTAPSAQGGVLLFASGAPVPLAPTQNYVKGLTVANNAIASLGANGKLSVRCTGSGTSHVILDVNGYFQ